MLNRRRRTKGPDNLAAVQAEVAAALRPGQDATIEESTRLAQRRMFLAAAAAEFAEPATAPSPAGAHDELEPDAAHLNLVTAHADSGQDAVLVDVEGIDPERARRALAQVQEALERRSARTGDL